MGDEASIAGAKRPSTKRVLTREKKRRRTKSPIVLASNDGKAESLLLNGLFLSHGLRRETRIRTGSKLLLEFVNSARRVDEFQLASVKRMAFAANVDP